MRIWREKYPELEAQMAEARENRVWSARVRARVALVHFSLAYQLPAIGFGFGAVALVVPLSVWDAPFSVSGKR